MQRVKSCLYVRAEVAVAGGKLTLDTRIKTIAGTVKTHPVKGGIFARGRIKKADKEIENALQALIEQATPSLED